MTYRYVLEDGVAFLAVSACVREGDGHHPVELEAPILEAYLSDDIETSCQCSQCICSVLERRRKRLDGF